jgi:programmed cell death 6-interacting protein
MSTNILAIPLKRTISTSLSEPLKEFISTFLGQNSEQFHDDLVKLDKLRADIVHVDVHPESLERLVLYYTQLQTIREKLPNDVGLGSWRG